MPIALEKLTRAEAVKLALLGFGLGLLPHALGLLLGFAAFVVTPVVGGLAAGACGFAAARMVRRTPWTGALMMCAVAGGTFAGLFCATIAVLAIINHEPWQIGGVLAASAALLLPVLAGSLVVCLGVLLGLRRRAA